MSEFDKIIFKDKTFADILEDIYTSKQNRSTKISTLVDHLNALVTNATDATIIVPVLNQCLETEIKNDDLLVKTAAIVQRQFVVAKSIESDPTGGLSLSDDEIKELESIRNKMLDPTKTDKFTQSIDNILDELSQAHEKLELPEHIQSKIDETEDEFDKIRNDFDKPDSDDAFDRLRKEIEGMI